MANGRLLTKELRLTVKSFNCRGLNDHKKCYIGSRLHDCDLSFIQERWLSSAQLDHLNILYPKDYATGVSDIGDEDVLRGRPYGGCAIVWLRNNHASVQIVSTNSRRIWVLSVCYDTINLLFINVYLPHEDGDANSDEFSRQRSITDNIVAQNQDFEVILGRDFNVDFSRNLSHTCLLNDFCSLTNLYPVIKHTCSIMDYTYHFNMSRFSVLDYFVVSGGLFDAAMSSFYSVHSRPTDATLALASRAGRSMSTL